MIHQLHCRNCNRQLLEATRVDHGEMLDANKVPPGVVRDASTGRYYKICPHCGARNGFREHTVPGGGRSLLLDGLLD